MRRARKREAKLLRWGGEQLPVFWCFVNILGGTEESNVGYIASQLCFWRQRKMERYSSPHTFINRSCCIILIIIEKWFLFNLLELCLRKRASERVSERKVRVVFNSFLLPFQALSCTTSIDFLMAKGFQWLSARLFSRFVNNLKVLQNKRSLRATLII